MVKQINQHVLSCNLNYRNEIAVNFMASKVVVTRRFPLLGWYSWEKERKKKTSILLKTMGVLVEQ